MTLRWPISSPPDGPTIGPPQLLQWYQTRDGFSCSRDGRHRRLAIYNGGGLVFDADQPTHSRRILPHRDTRGIALSPDGRWLVTHSHTYGSLNAWDTRTGQLIPDFPEIPRQVRALFSPDGRMLAVIEDQHWKVIETVTWRSMIRA